MSDFKSKMHQIRFPCSAPDPNVGAYSTLPDLPPVLKGPISKGYERGGMGKGRGRKGKGEEGFGTPKIFVVAPPK